MMKIVKLTVLEALDLETTVRRPLSLFCNSIAFVLYFFLQINVNDFDCNLFVLAVLENTQFTEQFRTFCKPQPRVFPTLSI